MLMSIQTSAQQVLFVGKFVNQNNFKKNMNIKSLLIVCLTVIIFSSCKKDESPYTVPVSLLKEWSIALSAKNENPAPASRNETGTATLQLFSDNSLKYTINVSGLAASDALIAAHIHVGNVISNGGVVLGIDPTFTGGVATGTKTNLRASLVDSLKSDANELYFNVHSTQVASGLLRGQLNTKLEMVADVALSGVNEVPAITTTASGTALLRLTSNKKLYYRVTVTGLEASDALLASHIHRAAAGANGAIFLDLYSSTGGLYGSAADFGTAKVVSVDDAQIVSLKADALYLNVHSSNKPSGVIRGQIR